MNTRITNVGQLVSPVPAQPSLGTASPLDVRSRTEIRIRDGRITAVGKGNRRESVDAEVDARGGVVLPGLIDPHTHFAPRADPASEDDRRDRVRQRVHGRLRRALRSGVTTVEVKCAGLEELDELSALERSSDDRLPEIVPTLFGPAPPHGASHAEQMAELIGDAIPGVRRRRLARFCDVECGDGAYTLAEARTILRAARAAGLHLKLHATGGSIGGLGSVASELGITAVGHAGDLTGQDPEEWRRVGLIPLLLPAEGMIRSGTCLGPRWLLDADLRFGLGTDAGAESVSAGSMWLVLALAVTGLGMSLERAIAAMTLHNAYGLESAAEIGTIEAGKRADLLILDVPDYRDLLSCLGEEPVRAVIRNGRIVHPR